MNIREQLLDLFRRNGVTRVDCNYSGYGDSGNLDDPTFDPPNTINLNAPFARTPHPWYPDQLMEMKVGDAVTNIFYQFLEATHAGWENNDGAQGEFFWDIATDKITLDHGENYMQTEHYSHEF